MHTMRKYIFRNLISPRNSFEVKVANERFILIDSRFRQTLNLEISRGLRLRNVLKCVPHVQHDYFSSFNQSHCFGALFLLPLLCRLCQNSLK